MKRIVISTHAAERMQQRGATRAEVEAAIRSVPWRPAQRGKSLVQMRFPYGAPSPANQRGYRFKKIEVIFVEEPNAIVVVTVKVFYQN